MEPSGKAAVTRTAAGRNPSEIARGRVIAIVRGIGPDRIVEIAGALLTGGIRAMEVTLNSPGALASIGRLAATFGSEDLLIGAGTVISVAAQLVASLEDAADGWRVWPGGARAWVDARAEALVR